MRKKRYCLIALAGWIAIPLFAAENLAPQELRRYGRSNVVVKEGEFLYHATPGKLTCVTWKTPLKKGYYGYSLEYRGVGEVPPQTVLKTAVKPEVQPDQYRRGWDVAEFSEAWKRVAGVFYMPADGTARMDAYVECKVPASVMVRNIKLFPLPEKELASVKVETAADLVLQWKLLWKFRNSSSRLELVPAEDHIEGGHAVKLTPEPGTRAGVESVSLPAEGNRNYRASVWLKADRELPVRFTADGWTSGEKHFYRYRKVLVTPEWQRYTFEFKTPELARYRGALRIQITPAGDCNWLQIKDAALTEVGGK